MDRILTATLLLLAAALAAMAPVALGQIPPGYWIQQVTDNNYQECPPRLNDRGQIVFERRSGPGGTGELFLYDRDSDTLTQLTDDAVWDVFPDINNDGVITWTRFIGAPDQFGPTGEIMIRDPDGTITRLTNDGATDRGPSINRLGHVAWYKYMGEVCSGIVTDVFFFGSSGIVQITSDGLPDGVVNQIPMVNDQDQVVWVRFDFCVNPWTSEVYMYDSGATTRLTDAQTQPGSADINNTGVVALFHRPPAGHTIQLWEERVTRDLTLGTGPRLNDRGDVAFHRWDANSQTWQEWLFHDGIDWQLSNDSFWNDSGDINALGEVCWRSGPVNTGNIRYLRRFEPGDLNCDGTVSSFDIEPFIVALFDPTGYPGQYADCDMTLADINDDGSVDAFDIEPFLVVLFP